MIAFAQICCTGERELSGMRCLGVFHLKQNEQVDGREQQEQCFSSSRGLWGLSCCTINIKSN